MLLLACIDIVISLFSWFLSLFPLPSLTDVFPKITIYFDYFIDSILPSAVSLFQLFVGPVAWTAVQFFIGFYLALLDFLLVYTVVWLLFWLFDKIKRLPFVS